MNEYEYDVFISYQWDAKPALVPLQRKLIDYNLTVFMDELGIQPSQIRVKSKITNTLKSTRLFIVCLTNLYAEIATTGDLHAQEIYFAHVRKIPFIVLVLEPVKLIKIAGLGQLISECPRYNCYKTPELLCEWSGPMFISIMEDIKKATKEDKVAVGSERGKAKGRKRTVPTMFIDGL